MGIVVMLSEIMANEMMEPKVECFSYDMDRDQWRDDVTTRFSPGCIFIHT